MRTELEFSIKLIVDPKEPVSEQEARAMLGMYEVLRSLQSPGGTTPQLEQLGQFVDRYRTGGPSRAITGGMSVTQRNSIWLERQAAAREALARIGDELVAARSLGLSFNMFRRWLNGPASAWRGKHEAPMS